MLRRLFAEGARKLARALRLQRTGGLLDSPPIISLRRALATPVSAGDVAGIIDRLAAGGVGCWLAGGWGVDALAGRQTRRHVDVDVMVDDSDGGGARARTILAGLGFEPVEDGAPGLAPWMPVRIKLRDGRGRTVELLPVPVRRPGEALAPLDPSVDQSFVYSPEHFTSGEVGSRVVPCLSAEIQLRTHAGYPLRPWDRRDVETVLRRLGKRPGETGRAEP